MVMPFDGSPAGEALGMMQWDDDNRRNMHNELDYLTSRYGEVDAESAKILLPIYVAIFSLFFFGIALL